VIRALQNLERIWHVHAAWDAGQVALDFRVQRHALGKIIFFLLERFRPVGKGAPFNNTESRRLGVRGAKLIKWASLRRMRFDIPVGFVDCLPDPVEIRLTIFCARGAISGGLRGLAKERQRRKETDCHYHRTYKPSSHSISIPPKTYIR
jgi:hypothetical protein